MSSRFPKIIIKKKSHIYINIPKKILDLTVRYRWVASFGKCTSFLGFLVHILRAQGSTFCSLVKPLLQKSLRSSTENDTEPIIKGYNFSNTTPDLSHKLKKKKKKKSPKFYIVIVFFTILIKPTELLGFFLTSLQTGSQPTL